VTASFYVAMAADVLSISSREVMRDDVAWGATDKAVAVTTCLLYAVGIRIKSTVWLCRGPAGRPPRRTVILTDVGQTVRT